MRNWKDNIKLQQKQAKNRAKSIDKAEKNLYNQIVTIKCQKKEVIIKVTKKIVNK